MNPGVWFGLFGFRVIWIGVFRTRHFLDRIGSGNVVFGLVFYFFINPEVKLN